HTPQHSHTHTHTHLHTHTHSHTRTHIQSVTAQHTMASCTYNIHQTSHAHIHTHTHTHTQRSVTHPLVALIAGAPPWLSAEAVRHSAQGHGDYLRRFEPLPSV